MGRGKRTLSLEWGVILAFLGTMALLVYLFAHPFMAASEKVQADSLTTMATIMGAVFTAGGLVVALVSIVTLISIRQQLRRAVEEAREQFRTELGTELPNMLNAFSLFLKAQSATTMDEAAMLVEEALAQSDHISGALYYIGSIMHKEARERFLSERRPLNSVSGLNPAAMAHRAIEWLQKARHRRDGPHARISAMLAECYGILGPDTRAAMFESLLDVANWEEDLKLCIPCLAHGCSGGDDVRRIANITKRTFLLGKEDLDVLLTEKLRRVTSHVWLWGVALTRTAPDPTYRLIPDPGIIQVQCHEPDEGPWGLRASWRAESGYCSLPLVPEGRGDDNNFVAAPAEMAAELTNRFLVFETSREGYTDYVEVIFDPKAKFA